jgi:NitT/TauT family transport system substrate-binding protein
MSTRKWLVLWVVVAALGMALAACGDDDEDEGGGGGGGGGSTAAEGTQEVELLLSFPESIAWAPLLVAREAGYFEEEGVSVKTQETEGSGFVTQQVIAGNADYGWAAGDSVIVAASKEPDIRAVACNQEQNIFRIVTLADNSEVQSVEDLDGKTLGFTEKGGGEEPLVNSTVADAGLEGKVQLLPIGAAGPQSRRAIEQGQVDAYASSYPDIATLTAQGLEFRDITPDKFSRTPGDCFVVMKDTLEDPEKRETVVKVGRAWVKGANFAIENPEAALEMSCPQVPEECKDRAFADEFMSQTLDLLKPLDESVPIGGLDLEGWKTTADVLLDVGTIKEPVDTEQTVNSPEVQEVVDEIQDFDLEAVKQDASKAGSGG